MIGYTCVGSNDLPRATAFYDELLALGGSDEGAPGLRCANLYGACFRDLDGNKLAAYCMLKAAK